MLIIQVVLNRARRSLVPQAVEVKVYNQLKKEVIFRASHGLNIMGFEKTEYPTKHEVADRVISLISLISVTGVPSKDFSA